MKTPILLVLTSAGLLLCACQQAMIDRTDRAVQTLIEERQRTSLGIAADASIGPETGGVARTNQMYRFTPHPLEPDLPEAFRPPSASTEAENPQTDNPPPQADDDLPAKQPTAADLEAPARSTAARPKAPTHPTNLDTGEPIVVEEEPFPEEAEHSPSIFSEDELKRRTVFGLRDALAYANSHARELQDAKEDLYLAALDLTLERHLWTPQFVASAQAEFADYGQVRDFDRAMSAVSEIAVSQRLPYGGEVTARIINGLMRDLGAHITSGESGTMILEANVPLFRGAGRVAYESRYQAERELVYAVRTYERFRRDFLVRVAGEYFDLQQAEASITNAYQSYLSLKASWEKEDFKNRIGVSRSIFDAPRAKASLRDAESSLVSAKAYYESALDQFKIFVGMPVDTLLDVVSQEDDAESEALERLLPDLTEKQAVDIALAYRLDLLSTVDQVDDARRSVLTAKNQILPDLDLSGSVTLDTDSNRKNSLSYNTERTTWRGFVNLRLDDRKAERNAYREALIALRRAQRYYEERVDIVRADVRHSLRRLAQQAKLRRIQALNVEENEFRLEAATEQNKLGKITNQDVVDADNDLLAARNRYASAVAAYRNAVLEFRRDTGTLRLSDDGGWDEPDRFSSLAPASGTDPQQPQGLRVPQSGG